ncbi:MAG: hypothetical protein ACFFDO_06340 [Candidatus Thorarchaeota archaeon]
MLSGFFIFESKTGTLLYDKVFFLEMDDEKLEMFQSFLIALKTFIARMQFDGSSTLKAINLGEYHVVLTHITDTNSELVMVMDEEDEKSSSKIVQQIKGIIINNKDLFIEPERTSEQFKQFDDEVNNLIRSSTKVIDATILEQKVNVFKSIWAQRGEISANLRDELINEKEDLVAKLESENNLLKKSRIYERLLDIFEKLNETDELLNYQKISKEVKDEVKDRQIKLKYYLGKTKEALKEKNYKEAYLNLYSFSSKLKNMAKSHIQKKYNDLAKLIMDKNELPKIEFSQIISEILMMPDKIEEYFS